jgi:hypothetical protein
MDKFNLSHDFVNQYRAIKPPFGFNGLGEFVYMRTYSRVKSNGSNESWCDTIERVVNGTMRILQEHAREHDLKHVDDQQLERWGEHMFDKMFNMKFLPPGRGLWAMGTPITEEKRLYAALQNCAFVTTEDIDTTKSKPFCFLMDASMLGVGVGFDTKGEGKLMVHKPSSFVRRYEIPDDREGWIESLRLLLDSYFVPHQMQVRFGYSLIRPAGAPIKTFGGISSGYEALQEVHEQIRSTLERNAGSYITLTTIVDIMNLIGKCVVSGNVRRTAEIAFGDPTDKYLNLKNYEANPHRMDYGWTSNNSIFATIGMDYEQIAERIVDNGEPGIAWLDNMRNYSRMWGSPDRKDSRVMGGNPCSPGFAPVLTPDGESDFDHIDVGSVVWSGFRWTQVVRKWYTGIKPVYEYRTAYGSFFGTEDHRVIERGRKVKVKDAKGIDLCPYPSDENRAPYTARIESVEYIGDYPVYDIMVDAPEHTYCTDGLLVSNCLEQSLESMELCTLVETFPNNHDSPDEYADTLFYALLYAKAVTLVDVHWPESVEVMSRNRRIGTSVTGVAQFINDRGIDELKSWLTTGYLVLRDFDGDLSERLNVPKSIKITSVKPSGTVSLLAGATPGVHYPESTYYIRRVRLSVFSPFYKSLKRAGYPIEPLVGDEDRTVVVSFPVKVDEGIKTHEQGISMWEQLSLAAFMQKYWADNQVSCTVTFDPKDANQIAPALDYFQYQLKGISFLPRHDYGAYPQMPYESITKEQYESLLARVKPIDFSSVLTDGSGEKFCSNDGCEI